MQAKRHKTGTKTLYKALSFAFFSDETHSRLRPTLREAAPRLCGSLFHSLPKSKYRIKINLHIWDTPFNFEFLVLKTYYISK
jgi:hypothetical protein